jgi:hypothetical protein
MNRMSWTDPRMIFAFLLLGIVARLAFAIAIGNVQEQSSYGLHELLLLLTVIGTKVVDSIFGGNPPPKP